MTDLVPLSAARDLDTVIEECLNLGMSPTEIRDQLANREGEEWLNAEIIARRDDFVYSIAQVRMRARTRSVERVLAPGDPRIQSEILLAKIHVPTEDGSWISIRYADATAEDLERRIAFDLGLAVGVMRQAFWLKECVAMIREQGVRTLGEVKGDLPALPSAEDVRELIAS